jgi:hypothetical protein
MCGRLALLLSKAPSLEALGAKSVDEECGMVRMPMTVTLLSRLLLLAPFRVTLKRS